MTPEDILESARALDPKVVDRVVRELTAVELFVTADCELTTRDHWTDYRVLKTKFKERSGGEDCTLLRTALRKYNIHIIDGRAYGVRLRDTWALLRQELRDALDDHLLSRAISDRCIAAQFRDEKGIVKILAAVEKHRRGEEYRGKLRDALLVIAAYERLRMYNRDTARRSEMYKLLGCEGRAASKMFKHCLMYVRNSEDFRVLYLHDDDNNELFHLRTCNSLPRDPTVMAIAEDISKGRSWEELPVLADALEDVGCANFLVLRHLRVGLPHLNRCFVLDKMLGYRFKGMNTAEFLSTDFSGADLRAWELPKDGGAGW